MRPKLVIMVKEPRPGRVKTRLGRDIGLTNAAWWFRHQTRALLRRIEDPRWDTLLAVSPDIEGMNSRVWPAQFPRVAQGRGDLGDRMARLLRGLPQGPVCIIGADIPAVSRPHIAEAFRALGNHEAVFGPAPDGGYWLVGMKRARPPIASILQNVRWSSKHALADSARSLGDVTIGMVQTLRDVDTAADLKHL